ncbi:hypothetical protein AB1Y20_006866 [Prymnesium parvum]|uniref:Uncharacterized protein n=1 Tax=Prymnesium parvum TaxID=97485 RepID=A0AB34J1W4_PRYPA
MLLLVALAVAPLAAAMREEAEALRHTRRELCHAVVTEMHTEIHKHSLRRHGEDDIYETVPAICLAVVQNYSLTKRAAPVRSWRLEKRAGRLDDEEHPDPASFAHLLTLKKICEAFTDEQQQELSELMYKETYAKDPAEIREAFCTGEVIAPPPPPRKQPAARTSSSEEQGDAQSTRGKARKEGRRAKEAEKETSKMPSMEDMLKKYDTDGSISNLIEMERESPELMLEPEELQEVQTGAGQLRCDVCRAATTVAHRRAKKGKLRDEAQLTELVSSLCVGTPEGSLEYPKYPGNPPLWGELYTLSKKLGRWSMERLKKGAQKEEKAGKEGGVDYNRLIMKHSMISRACKNVVHEHPELDLAEYMFSHSQDSAAELAAGFCNRFFCLDASENKDEL